MFYEARITFRKENVMTDPEQAKREMPKYKCHKVVHALQIAYVEISTVGSAMIHPVDSRYAPFRVGVDYVNNHKPQDGGYYVVYEDGYQSWSPKEAFES